MKLFEELGVEIVGKDKIRGAPLFIHEDNQSCIEYLKNPVQYSKMKHLEIILYWVRDEVAKGTVEFKWTTTLDQLADIGTKALYYKSFTSLRDRLMQRPPISHSGGVLEQE